MHEFEADSADAYHLQIEAMKLAFADTHAYVAIPLHEEVTPEQLLDAAYLASRAKLIDRKRAQNFGAGEPSERRHGLLAAADEMA